MMETKVRLKLSLNYNSVALVTMYVKALIKNLNRFKTSAKQ